MQKSHRYRFPEAGAADAHVVLKAQFISSDVLLDVGEILLRGERDAIECGEALAMAGMGGGLRDEDEHESEAEEYELGAGHFVVRFKEGHHKEDFPKE